MTIDEAIRIKEKDFANSFFEPGSKLAQADRLSIEALKQLQEERKQRVGFWADRLPGETEK